MQIYAYKSSIQFGVIVIIQIILLKSLLRIELQFCRTPTSLRPVFILA